MLNLATLLEQSAARVPGKMALIADQVRMSYAELNGAANKLANSLRGLGVGPGANVALMMPNLPFFPVAYYAILKLGARVVPLNVLFKRNEVQYHLEDSDAVALIVWEGLLDEAASGFAAVPACRHLIVAQAPASQAALPEGALPLAALLADSPPLFETYQTTPEDTAVILYTSGTTGRPKGAELSHANMAFNAMVSADRVMRIDQDDVLLCTLPLFHSFGQTCVMNLTFYVGATLTMIPRFEPARALEVMQRDQVTAFLGVPTMYFFLLNYPDADKFQLKLRRCVAGGSSMPVDVMQRFNQKYNVVIQEGYGLSETSPVASFNHLDRPAKPGSIGTPVWGVDMRVVGPDDQELPAGELGEILIRGHNVMKGYYKRPDATAEALRGGWFHTGDIAQRDEEGYFFIVDRIKDLIIRGGMNIYPREIEEVLYSHAAVAEAAVVGIADEAMGEEVKAVVALKPGQQASAEELMAFCKSRLAAFKYPRSIEFRDTLPKTATGKILKRELR